MSKYSFKLPDLGEGTVESEIGQWFVKVGDRVAKEDLIATMITDKAAVEIPSPVSGKVVKLTGEPGDVIAVGSTLIEFEMNTAALEAAKQEQVAEVIDQKAASAAADADMSGRSKVVTSPAIRRRAKEAGINLSRINGSGPGGRIGRNDIDRYLLERSPAEVPPAKALSASPIAEVKVIGLRRVIAEHMSKANREIPHFSYVDETDVTELEALRNHVNETRHDAERLTLLPFIGLALVRALKDFPQCNMTYDKDRNLLIRHDAVHLGVATQTPDGLKVPVVKHCQRRSLNDLAAEIGRLSNAARDNSIRKEELSGSTVTITSLGKLGGIVTTPIINIPEVAIIGVNRAVERAVVIDGRIATRLMMNLSSSFDHRFVDGYDAAAIVQRIKEMLEHPGTIFLSN